MRTFSLALLVLLVAAVTMTNGTPIKKSQVSVFGSRQKRETNTDMPGSTDEDDGIDFDEPKDDGIVIMIEQVVGGPRAAEQTAETALGERRGSAKYEVGWKKIAKKKWKRMRLLNII
ncbi:uncharacterized protein [Penaeus vannamei]|uniref:uncharacterized protein n=1 Tax=Penaeus vannamei TaxID=6689 RepID=UPI00387FA6AD